MTKPLLAPLAAAALVLPFVAAPVSAQQAAPATPRRGMPKLPKMSA